MKEKDLRCNHCDQLQNNFCKKLKHGLENNSAKLYHGGTIGKFGPNKDITYPSRCGIER